MNNLIIRKSRINPSLILICNIEKVYRIFYDGIERFNGIDYNEVSNYFESIEKFIVNKGEFYEQE